MSTGIQSHGRRYHLARVLSVAMVVTGLGVYRAALAGVPVCGPTQNMMQCEAVVCPMSDDRCTPTCVRVNPQNNQVLVEACECLSPNDCHVSLQLPNPNSGCTAPDNGGGTADLPPLICQYLNDNDPWFIITGLPVGNSIEIDTRMTNFVGAVEFPGGGLGGHVQQYQADLLLPMDGMGPGPIGGLTRFMTVFVNVETHSAPRTPGASVQGFNTEARSLCGEVFGDPDFCTFKIRAGSVFALPSPGQTTLVQIPGFQYAVDSFFDVTYQIEFVGCPGSILEGYSGTTTGTSRMRIISQLPACDGGCPPGQVCHRQITQQGNSYLVCCDCIAPPCDCVGDIDFSGVLDGLDVQGFIRCLLGAGEPGDACGCADSDGGGVTIDDIGQFIDRILQKPPCQPV